MKADAYGVRRVSFCKQIRPREDGSPQGQDARLRRLGSRQPCRRPRPTGAPLNALPKQTLNIGGAVLTATNDSALNFESGCADFNGGLLNENYGIWHMAYAIWLLWRVSL